VDAAGDSLRMRAALRAMDVLVVSGRWDIALRVLDFAWNLELHCTRFADLDPWHRGLLNLLTQGQHHTALLGPRTRHSADVERSLKFAADC
jgi:hypothetical protein